MKNRLVAAFAFVSFSSTYAPPVLGDDAIVPTNQTGIELPVSAWMISSVTLSGGIIARVPTVSIVLAGVAEGDVCAETSDGSCREAVFDYVGAPALAIIRQLNTVDLGTGPSFAQRIFAKLRNDGKIGAGTYSEAVVECERHRQQPNPEATPQPDIVRNCVSSRWTLNTPPPLVESPVRKVQLDRVQVGFSGGWMANITGVAAAVTDGDSCAMGEVEDDDGTNIFRVTKCQSSEWIINDKDKVEELMTNDGTATRLRRRILSELQTAGDLPAGTVGGDPL